MPMIDINADEFSVTSLTAAINEEQQLPGQINNSGLFQEEGITTTTIQIEKNGESLSLVPSQSRGGPGKVVNSTKANMIPFNTIHLPQQATISADEVQNVRAFGQEASTKTVANEIAKRALKMRRQNDATIEHLKVGALKGQIIDADGSTQLLDIYSQFGLTQTIYNMAINTTTTKMNDKVRALLDLAEDQMNGISFTGAKAFCGRSFYNAFASHPKVEAAYDRWNAGAFLRDGLKNPFDFADVEWVKYRGAIGAYRFIPDNDAYLVLTGVPDLFITRYAPANYSETVNTTGLPHYAKMHPLEFDKGFMLEVQSNPICLCTRPQAIIKLSMA